LIKVLKYRKTKIFDDQKQIELIGFKLKESFCRQRFKFCRQNDQKLDGSSFVVFGDLRTLWRIISHLHMKIFPTATDPRSNVKLIYLFSIFMASTALQENMDPNFAAFQLQLS
jgi:hypothetical protein